MFSTSARVHGQRVGQRAPLPHQFVDRVHGVEAARPEALVVPCVLADGDGQRLAVQQGQGLMFGRLKVALLVEDVVERQQHLLLHEAHPPAGEQRGNIARVLPFVWPAIHRAGGEDRAAQNRRAIGGVGRNLIQRLSRAVQKRPLLQQVGRRVSADGEFRKHRQLRAGLRGARGKVEDQPRVSGKVPNGWVDLGQCDLHEYKSTGELVLRSPLFVLRCSEERNRTPFFCEERSTAKLSYVPVPLRTTPMVRTRIFMSRNRLQFST